MGGGNEEGTLSAMIDALSVSSPKETFLKKLIYAVADGESVNFGCHQGALTKLSEMVGWDLPTLHCFNHKLELAMKDSYTSDKTFTEIKEMLDVLHRLFKNSGRSWHIYQRVAETLNLVPLCFTRVGGTRSQPHTLNALSSFLQKFLMTMLFAENVEEQGSGKESLVTREMYPKIIGFKKKWRQLKFLASANTFFRVLNETAHFLMEGDTAMIYQIQETTDDAILNLKDILKRKIHHFH